MTTEITTTEKVNDRFTKIVEGEKKFPPKLSTNADPEFPLGAYTLNHKGTDIYMTTTQFRLGECPLVSYSRYNDKLNKMECFTVYERNNFGEFPDSLGSFRCGRLTNKQLQEYSDEEKEENRALGKYNVTIFGQVDISEATYADGTPVVTSPGTEWSSCHMKFSSTRAMNNFKTIEDMFKTKMWYSKSVALNKATKEKTGNNVYYVAQLGTGVPQDILGDEGYRQYAEHVIAFVEGSNDYVMTLHYDKAGEDDTPDADLQLVDQDTLEDDELPESMQ